jgi:hypothetical protein
MSISCVCGHSVDTHGDGQEDPAAAPCHHESVAHRRRIEVFGHGSVWSDFCPCEGFTTG